jgi:hypothetical protein
MKIRPMQIAINQPSRHSGFFISETYPFWLIQGRKRQNKKAL